MVIKGMNPTSATGPDGLPLKFFQTFRDIVKPKVMAIFEEFYVGSIDLPGLTTGSSLSCPNCRGPQTFANSAQSR